MASRPISDAVTTLGAGVNNAVLRLETAYDGQQNAYLFTSYNAASAGTVVNQVQRGYNGLGQLTIEYQNHNGVVNTGTSLKTQYAYSWAPTGSTNHSRLTQITYPNAQTVNYAYASGLNDNISRLTGVSVAAQSVEGYNYMGLGTVIERTHTGTGTPNVDLSYVLQGVEAIGDAGDIYTGLDRFGRVVNQRWRSSTDNTNRDRYSYVYDRDSNHTSRTNVVNATFNETYSYDGLNQLLSYNRTGVAKSWDYDSVGNWDGVTTNGTTQSRAHNKQNELGVTTGQTTPTYDANGNQTKDFGNRTSTYDAWNRVRTASTRTYEYDALNRRIEEVTGGVTTDSYYTADWQVVEERVTNVARRQYVWSPVYVDALILRDRDSNSDGSLEQRQWVSQDANFNVTSLINSSGTVQERYVYDPYGTVSYYDGAYASIANTLYAWDRLHQGLKWDATTGKYHARNRDYDPAQGRWTSLDPMGFGAGDMDLYRAYAGGPMGAVDPSGLVTWSIGWRFSKSQNKDLWAAMGPVQTAIDEAAKKAQEWLDNKAANSFLTNVKDHFVEAADKADVDIVATTACVVADMLIKFKKAYAEMPTLYFRARTRNSIFGSDGTASRASWTFIYNTDTIFIDARPGNQFFQKDATGKAQVLIHELTHLLLDTKDHGYVIEVNPPAVRDDEKYEDKNSVPLPALSTKLRITNASTYEWFFRAVIL